jgi:hypothetical protein
MNDEITILLGSLFMALVDLLLYIITEGEWYRPLFGGLFLLAAAIVVVAVAVKTENEY